MVHLVQILHKLLLVQAMDRLLFAGAGVAGEQLRIALQTGTLLSIRLPLDVFANRPAFDDQVLPRADHGLDQVDSLVQLLKRQVLQVLQNVLFLPELFVKVRLADRDQHTARRNAGDADLARNSPEELLLTEAFIYPQKLNLLERRESNRN